MARVMENAQMIDNKNGEGDGEIQGHEARFHLFASRDALVGAE